MKKYIVIFDTSRGYRIEAKNADEAKEKAMAGDFDENDCIKYNEELVDVINEEEYEQGK